VATKQGETHVLNGTRKERRFVPSVTSATFITSLLFLATLALSGCQPAETTKVAPAAAPREAETSSATTEDDGQPRQTGNRETWDALYMGGVRVGHNHTQFATLQENGQTLVQIKMFTKIFVRRFNQTLDQEITVTSIEQPDGRVVRFSSITGAPNNPAATKVLGHYQGGKLHLTTTTLDKSTETSLAWDPTWHGFFGVEQSLLAKPMKPGQQRTIRLLVAGFNTTGEIDLKAIGYETTKLLSEEQSLLRIESRTHIAGTDIDSVLWTDAKGETIKQDIAALNQESFRTSREIALKSADGPLFDLGAASVVKVERVLDNPHRTRNVIYKATIPDGDPLKAFPSSATQSVKRIDEHTAEITVRALRAENAVAEALAASQAPTAKDLEPNNLLQSDDPAVIEIADSVAVGATNAWQIALALEKRVQKLVQVTDFSPAIASASEVARDKLGDCTEHAMLLAAACRARKIPARVAVGLVYYGQAGGFAYHMWTEVWIDNHWIPLDATLGQGGIGAAHIKVAESNLSGEIYAAIQPVFEVMGRLKLEIVAVDGE